MILERVIRAGLSEKVTFDRGLIEQKEPATEKLLCQKEE